MPGANLGEGYVATNMQLCATTIASSMQKPREQRVRPGFRQDAAVGGAKALVDSSRTVARNIMGVFTPEKLPVLSGLACGLCGLRSLVCLRAHRDYA